MSAAGRLELGRIGLRGDTLLDSENSARDGELAVRVRILGNPATTGRPIEDGSRLVVRTSVHGHRDDDDELTLVTSELELLGRLDLDHVDRLLAGTFAEIWTGIGIERAGYANGDHDNSSVLLGGFRWGMYLGQRGEATLFYDHRRDSIAGGISVFHSSGFVGSVGAAVDVVVAPHWGIRTQLEIGSAYLTTLALRYQGGSR